MTEREEVLRYATRLACSLWSKHWQAESPNWEPLTDLLGLLTQINNMTYSLARAQPQGEPVAVVRAGRQVIWLQKVPEEGTRLYLGPSTSLPAQAVPEDDPLNVCARYGAEIDAMLSAAPKPGGKSDEELERGARRSALFDE